MPVLKSGSTGSDRTRNRYRWRGQKGLGSNLLGLLYLHRIKILWTTLLVTALLLFAWLIGLFIFAPKRTPIVVLSAANYLWPLPPNAWATEDVSRLTVMNGKSITMRGHDEPFASKAEFLERLDQEIESSQGQSPNLPLIIWLNMHGVADAAEGSLRLIPPNASPSDPATWIDVDELSARLAKIPRQRNTLLILDCQRMQVNWNIGLITNRFSERVQQAFRDEGTANLAILLAAGPGQQAAVSPDLQGSAFGYYLQQGLAGAADRHQASGNHNGWVSLSELTAYLQLHVNRWSTQNLGVAQVPLLLTQSDDIDFPLARSLNLQSLDKLLEDNRKSQRLAPTIPVANLDRLWQQLDEFRELRLYQREPVAWRDLEHRLLWLEQLSASGNGYRSTAIRTLDEAEGQWKAIQARLARAAHSNFVSDSCSVLSGVRWRLPHSTQMHSLPLAEYFGQLEMESAIKLRELIEKLGKQPGPELLADTLGELEKEVGSNLEVTHFLKMLARYQFQGLWEQSRYVGELLGLQADIRNLAVPREPAGLPSDLRVHNWTRLLVSNTNVIRRQAEDSIFIQAQPGLAEHLGSARSSYQTAVQASQSLRQVMQTCDRAMAETPYLAQWLTHPMHNESSDLVSEKVNNRLLPLIFSTWELSEQLADFPQTTTEAAVVRGELEAIQRSANENVETPLNAFYDDFEGWCKDLLDASEANNPETVRELEAALSIPLATWDSRRQLRSARNRLTLRLHENYDEGQRGQGDTDVAPRGQNTKSYSARIDDWNQHPLLAVLDQQAESGVSNPIQRLLVDIESQLAQQAQALTLADQRLECSIAARRFRAAAPVWFAMPERDPVSELCQLDLQALLVWHAESSIADFWGPAGSARAFFDLAASDYLAAASEFTRLRFAVDSPPQELAEIEDLTTRLMASRRKAPTWLTTETKPTIRLDTSDPVQSEIMITVTPTERLINENSFVSPSGTAAVFAQSQQVRVQETSFEPIAAVSLPNANANISITLPSEAVESGLQALTMFRGHEYGGPFKIEQLGGVSVALNPYSYKRSEVTLNSPWDKLSVAFILDCSRSMGDPLASTNEDPAISRLEVAKRALQEMLIKLSLRQNVRLGVHFFGHRLGWSTDTPLRPLTRPDFTGVIGADLTPSQDVETVLTLGEFDLKAAQNVFPQVNAVKPWGQSPLYLSVLRALDGFGSGDSNADRHVIVVTDGANYQYIPATESDAQATTVEEVRAAALRQKIPIDVLGIGMDRAQDREATEEFSRLCKDTGGQFQALTSSTDLQTALRNLLEPGKYRLGRERVGEVADRESVVGTPIRVTPAPRTTERYWVTYEGREFVDPEAALPDDARGAQEEVWLEGGESIQLYVNQQTDAIQAFPFERDVAAAGILITGQGESTEYVFRIHQPFRESQDVTFPVSWQRLDARTDSQLQLWRATSRPAEVWVEVQPVSSSGEPVGQSYVFFDANYEPDQPVPLINLHSLNWPKTGYRARVRLWCRPPLLSNLELTSPNSSLELPPPPSHFEVPAPIVSDADVPSHEKFRKRFPLSEALQSPIELTPGVILRADQRLSQAAGQPHRLRFILQHAAAAPPVSSIRLRFPKSVWKKPSRIVRQFDAEHRLAVHTYYLDLPPADWPADIELSNKEVETTDSWQVTEEMTVDVLEANNLLPVFGAASRK